MKRVMILYGTRPEAIKLAPIVRQLGLSKNLTPIVAVTGQHREMLDQVNHQFGIVPEFDLNLMVPGARLDDMAGRALAACGNLLARVAPDVLVVQGDTTTTLMAALAAFYNQIPVAHVEAGLRTATLAAPFPEEGNRRLISPIAALHLAPTESSRDNLLRENVQPGSIAVTGNTVIDALGLALEMPAYFETLALEEVVASGGRVVLLTLHRRESWGLPMQRVMRAVRLTLERFEDVHLVVPMHRNPLVRDVIEQELDGFERAILLEPLPYREFCHAMRAAHLIITDSGGVQEEAPSLGKPVLVLREDTERREALSVGTVELIGTEQHYIAERLGRLLGDDDEYARMANPCNPYGDGRAAERCVAAIGAFLSVGERLPDFSPGSGQDRER